MADIQFICKYIFTFLISVHNTISLSHHEQVCLEIPLPSSCNIDDYVCRTYLKEICGPGWKQ